MKQIRIVQIILLVLCCSVLYAQEEKATTEQKHEMEKTSVKELTTFHELLHPLVHEAYPAKDYGTIRKAIPDLIKSAAKIRTAKLPKEMKDKKKEFAGESKKLLKELKALDKKQNKLSDEQFAEQFMDMHDTFEKLMEITR